MSNHEEERYSLEEILAEFGGEPENKKEAETPAPAAEVQKETIPGVQEDKHSPLEMLFSRNSQENRQDEPAQKAEKPKPQTSVSEEEPDVPKIMEDFFRARHLKVETDDLSQPRKEKTEPQGKPAEETKGKRVKETSANTPEPAGHREMLEKERQPLQFPGKKTEEGARLKDVPKPPLRVAPSQEDIQKNAGSAPWRTAAVAPQPKVPAAEKPAGKKAASKMRTIDLDGLKESKPISFMPEASAFEKPVEEDFPRPVKKKIPYDTVNVPCEESGQMAGKLSKKIGSITARLLLFFPVCATAIYAAGTVTQGWPMLPQYSCEKYPLYWLLGFALLQLLAMLLCREVTVSGLKRLLCLKPTLDSAVTVSALISLAYCLVSAFLPAANAGMNYVSVNTVTCFFALLAKRQRYEALRRNYKAITMGTAPAGIKMYSDGKVQDMAVKTQSGVDVDLKALAEYDFTERFSCYYTPIILIFAAALAVSASVAKGEAERFLWSISAILSVVAPMCLLLSSSAPAKRLGKKLYTSGSMLVNSVTAGRLSKCRSVVVRDADLYPAGAVKITGMKIAENQEPEIVVGCAASILQEVGGGLGKAFVEFARQQYIVPNKARELRFFDTRGICATVSGKYVQLGTAGYLIRMGVKVTEGLKLKNSIFIAIDSQFAGIFSMRYEAQTPVYAAFGMLRQAKVRPVLAVRDTVQTQTLVENRFELKRDSTFMPDLEERLSYSSSSFAKEEETLALLSRDGLLPLAETVSAAKKWRQSAALGCGWSCVCTVAGMLILSFLTGKGAGAAADPFNVLLYLLLWSIPAKMIRGIITRL